MNEGISIVERFGPSLLVPGKFEFIAIDCLVKRPQHACVESMMSHPKHVIITGRNGGLIQLQLETRIDGKNIHFMPQAKGPASILVFGF